VIIDHRESDTPHFPMYVRSVHPNHGICPGMEYRSSLRWFPVDSSKRSVYQIPFISKSGKFSASTLCFWRAYPEQVIMSIISTVYQRLLKILLKRFTYVDRGYRDCLIKISAIYTINKNDFVLDRFLGMARKGTPKRSVRNFVHYCAIQLDDDKRFVYSQALRRADWLKFQAKGPGDKSSKHCCHQTHLTNLGAFEDTHYSLYSSFHNLTRFWESEHFSITFGSAAHLLGDLELEPFVTENTQAVNDFLRDDLW
jgi:hypothetical protein